MVGGKLREVATYGGRCLLSDGWKYYDQRRGDSRHPLRFVGYFETDSQAIAAWLDWMGVGR